MRGGLTVILICISLIANDAEPFFKSLLAIWVSSFLICSIKSFAYIFLAYVFINCPSSYSFVEVLYIFFLFPPPRG